MLFIGLMMPHDESKRVAIL